MWSILHVYVSTAQTHHITLLVEFPWILDVITSFSGLFMTGNLIRVNAKKHLYKVWFYCFIVDKLYLKFMGQFMLVVTVMSFQVVLVLCIIMFMIENLDFSVFASWFITQSWLVLCYCIIYCQCLAWSHFLFYCLVSNIVLIGFIHSRAAGSRLMLLACLLQIHKGQTLSISETFQVSQSPQQLPPFVQPSLFIKWAYCVPQGNLGKYQLSVSPWSCVSKISSRYTFSAHLPLFNSLSLWKQQVYTHILSETIEWEWV